MSGNRSDITVPRTAPYPGTRATVLPTTLTPYLSQPRTSYHPNIYHGVPSPYARSLFARGSVEATECVTLSVPAAYSKRRSGSVCDSASESASRSSVSFSGLSGGVKAVTTKSCGNQKKLTASVTHHGKKEVDGLPKK